MSMESNCLLDRLIHLLHLVILKQCTQKLFIDFNNTIELLDNRSVLGNHLLCLHFLLVALFEKLH